MKKHVLVTGGAGFIGHHMIRRLLKHEEYEITCLDRLDFSGNLNRLSELGQEFVVDYYHPVERFQTTMDYIQLIDLHSKSVGYSVYHFTAFPLFQGETDIPNNPKLEEIYKEFQIENAYLLDSSLESFRLENYNISTTHRYTKNDYHPTPLCHWDYVEKNIALKLGIELTQSNKVNILKEQDNLIQRGITIR